MVYKKTIFLDSDPTKNLNTWQDFSIDLAGIFRQEPGAIYRIQLSFKQDYSLYPCGGSTVLPHHTASEGLTKVASGDLTEEEEEIVTEDGYEVKFFFVELYESVCRFLFGE